jgi:hypothetical protein
MIATFPMDRLVVGLCAFMLLVALTACAGQALKAPMKTWDGWLGKHKDDVVKEWGIPKQCVSLRSGEVCEWDAPGVAPGDRVTFDFTKDGLACHWTYRGFYGERRSEPACPQ